MELLAPAGNKDNFFESINNGADAVYLGLDLFSARASAENFTLDNLGYYLNYAHTFGVKVYCAMNTIIKNSEISIFLEKLIKAYNLGVDAFILQDVFLGKYIKENYPEIELHLSTQAGVNNLLSAKLAKEYGFSRVILSRETNINEIKQIASFIETEIFIHGALCSSFSGHCYYSAFIGGNSGNRGMCKQPCRQEFEYFGNDKIEFGKYNLSLSDLKLAKFYNEIVNAGVKSIKIEGRMRSAEYVAKAVSLYRAVIDGKNYIDLEQDLAKIYNRGDYTCGYLIDRKNVISSKIQSHKGVYFTNIIKITPKYLICNRNSTENNAFKIIRNGVEVGNAVFSNGKYLYKGNPKIGDKLYVTKDNELISRTLGQKKFKRITLNVNVIDKKLQVYCVENGLYYHSDELIENAITKSTSREELELNFKKVDVLPFDIKVNFDSFSDNIFIVKSKLNAFRRDLLNKIFNSFTNIKQLKMLDIIKDYEDNYDIGTLYIDDELSEKTNVYYPTNFSVLNNLNKTNVYLYIPAFLNDKDFNIIKQNLFKFKGVYADGLCGIQIAKDFKLDLIVGSGLNISNDIDIQILKKDFPKCKIVLSKELRVDEMPKHQYVLCGNTTLMEFIYCPFNNNCDKCNKKSWYDCKDKYDNFKLRRYVLSECRFELYLNKFINCNCDKKIFNLIGLSKEDKNSVYNGNFTKIKENSGRYVKGVK